MASEATTINALHESAWRGVLVFSGGGSQLIGMLSAQPGASSTLLEASVPYSRAALTEYIGTEPEQYCAAATARAMAVQAFRRALTLGDGSSSSASSGTSSRREDLFGFGCCASLTSKQPKKGQRRIHLALQTLAETLSWSITLDQATSRAEEERLAALLGMDLLTSGLRLSQPALAKLGDAHLDSRSFQAPAAWQSVLTGESEAAAQNNLAAPEAARKLIFSGSFNPFHHGHLEISKDAERRLNLKLDYELCINHPDKSALDYQEIDARLLGIPKGSRIWLTALPTFIEKCRHFPNSTFVVGIDTFKRILEPAYYGKDALDTADLAAQISTTGCDFLVYGRLSNGKFHSLSDCEIPAQFRPLCSEVGEREFRQDVSSTAIRASQNLR